MYRKAGPQRIRKKSHQLLEAAYGTLGKLSSRNSFSTPKLSINVKGWPKAHRCSIHYYYLLCHN